MVECVVVGSSSHYGDQEAERERDSMIRPEYFFGGFTEELIDSV